MATDLSATTFDELLQGLDDEQRAMLEEAPRQNRLPLLAQFRRESEVDCARKLAAASGLGFVEQFQLPEGASRLLPIRLIHEYQALPFEGIEGEATDGEHVPLVTCWPPEPDMDEWVYAVVGRYPSWHICPSKVLVNTLTQNFGVGAESLAESDIATEEREAEESEDENAAIIRFVNEIIAKAVEDRATDIHFEPLKDSLQIRYRIDGELVPIRVPDNLIRYQAAIISRLKIMARLNISEKRRPQDGRITYRGGSGTELDIRISTMPTMYGESVSLRLLNQKNQPLSMEELGMLKHDQAVIKRVLDLPHGIILVTGPTGSGKSTSLTAFIRQINSPGRRIITVEDPVEYEVAGVNQTQVHTEIGYTFASALRHILRQDPDVIMVGEVRDQDTAITAVRAANTGNLVLATTHATRASRAVETLLSLGVDPFFLSLALQGVLAQVLVKRLCEHCKTPLPETGEMILDDSIRRRLPDGVEPQLHYGEGCDHCFHTGYHDRMGLFELFIPDDQARRQIRSGTSASELEHICHSESLLNQEQAGKLAAVRGKTTMEELLEVLHL